MVAVTLERHHAQQVLEWIVHVAAIHRLVSARHPPLPEQRHHVIEPQRPAIAHAGADQRGERRIRRAPQLAWILRRDAPLLPRYAQRVGRRADGRTHAVESLVGPGFGARSIHANGVITVQPHAEAEFARQPAHGTELIGCQPLQVGEEIHVVGVFAGEPLHGVAARVVVLLRPVLPAGVRAQRLAEMPIQRVEQRMQAQRLTVFGEKITELRGARRVRVQVDFAEQAVTRLEHWKFERRHARVVHLRSSAHLRQLRLEHARFGESPRPLRGAYVGNRVHVDEHDVQCVPARGRIRRIQRRIGRKQRMQRAHTHESRTGRRRQAQQFGEIGEVADAPVVVGAQRVDLRGHAPDFPRSGELGRFMRTIRRDDQRATLPAAELQVDFQAVVTRRQVFGQRQVAQHVPASFALVRAALRQAPGTHLATALGALLQHHAPAQQRILIDGRCVHAHVPRTDPGHGDVA